MHNLVPQVNTAKKEFAKAEAAEKTAHIEAGRICKPGKPWNGFSHVGPWICLPGADWWIGKAKERKEAEVLLKDSQAQFETAEAGFWALEVALYKILRLRRPDLI